MTGWRGIAALVSAIVISAVLMLDQPSRAAESGDGDRIVLVEPHGLWHALIGGQSDYTFWYGVDGDVPLLGDWDGDGFDTPGAYRPTSGFAYLSNDLPVDGGVGVGDPELTFFFGVPGDQVVVGDWDGDGVDTLGIRRDGRMFLTNRNATGIADLDFWFGDPTDLGFGGDADGDGADGVFLYRSLRGAIGDVHYTNSAPAGSGSVAITAGSFDSGYRTTGRMVVGDWDGDGTDSVGFREAHSAKVLLHNGLSGGPDDVSYTWGQPDWVPVAGHLDLPPPVTYELSTHPGWLDGIWYGQVTSDLPGITCAASHSADCAEEYPSGTRVTLTAVMNDAGRFVEWAGGVCGTANPCTITLTSDLQVDPVWEWQLPIRVNAGGPRLTSANGAPWLEDTPEEPSRFVNFTAGDPGNLTAGWPTPELDNSVPGHVPAAVFATERYDQPDGPEMRWSIPVEAGRWVEVRLYFANGFPGAARPTDRLFDVSIDDWLVLDDYDIVADVGHQMGVMKRFVAWTDDDGLDIHFQHTNPTFQNPLINAIEVVEPARLVVVPGGGDPVSSGQALATALADVAAYPKSAGAEWIVKLEPGRYGISQQLAMESHVEIEGSGKHQTVIDSSFLPAGTDVVAGASSSTIRHLTIEVHDDDWDIVTGIDNQGVSPRIESVRLELWGTGLTAISNHTSQARMMDIDVESFPVGGHHRGIENFSSSTVISSTDLSVAVTGVGGTSTGVSLNNSSVSLSSSSIIATNTDWSAIGVSAAQGSILTGRRLEVEASSGYHVGHGISGIDSTLAVEDSQVSVATRSTVSYGVRVENSSLVLTNVAVTNTSGGPPYAVHTTNSDATIVASELSAEEPNYHTGWGLYNVGGLAPRTVTMVDSTVHAPSSTIRTETGVITTVSNSTLDGGPTLGAVSCQNVWDEHGTFYPNACPD